MTRAVVIAASLSLPIWALLIANGLWLVIAALVVPGLLVTMPRRVQA